MTKLYTELMYLNLCKVLFQISALDLKISLNGFQIGVLKSCKEQLRFIFESRG